MDAETLYAYQSQIAISILGLLVLAVLLSRNSWVKKLGDYSTRRRRKDPSRDYESLTMDKTRLNRMLLWPMDEGFFVSSYNLFIAGTFLIPWHACKLEIKRTKLLGIEIKEGLLHVRCGTNTHVLKFGYNIAEEILEKGYLKEGT